MIDLVGLMKHKNKLPSLFTSFSMQNAFSGTMNSALRSFCHSQVDKWTISEEQVGFKFTLLSREKNGNQENFNITAAA